jgi:hypothetical protein
MQLNNTGLKLGLNGTAASPAFSFVGDPNTGIYNSFPDMIDFSSGGVHAMQIHNAMVSVLGNFKVFGATAIMGSSSSTNFSIIREASISGPGSAFTIFGQRGAAGNNAGGSLDLVAGTSTGTANGGRLLLDGGQASGTGSPGIVQLGNFSSQILIGGPATDSISAFKSIDGTVAKIRTETTDLTPSVANLTVLFLNYAPTLSFISNLVDGVDGQCVNLISSGTVAAPYIAIADGGNFRLSGGWTAGPNSTLTVCRVAGGIWVETSRSVN